MDAQSKNTLAAAAVIERKSTWLIGALFLLVFAPVLVDLVQRWWDDSNYSHGFLVPLIAAYFLWHKRAELAGLAVRPSRLGLLLLVIGMTLFVFGNAGVEYFIIAISMVMVLFGLALYLLGAEFIRRTWFAFFILLFMIPIPGVIYYSLTFPMQLLASKVSVEMMQGLGMSVLRQGNIIVLPDRPLEVAEACSGMRSLISLMAMGAIFGYMSQPKFWGKMAIFLLAIPVAVIGNVVRVFLTAVIAYVGQLDPTTEPYHTLLGLSVFVVAFVLLSILAVGLRRLSR